VPQGLGIQDLNRICERDVVQLIDQLVDCSLVSHDSKTEKYKIYPIIDQYVEQKVSEEQRKSLAKVVSSYYNIAIPELLEKYAKNRDEDLINNYLLSHERNIKKLIKYDLVSNKSSQYLEETK